MLVKNIKIATSIFIISIFIFLSNDSIAQSIKKVITGKVLNGQTNEPLPFANIFVTDKNIGTTTNENGLFKLELPFDNGEILFSYIGFKTEIIDISELNPKKSIMVYLFQKDMFLQEVSVYAGVKSKENEIEVSALSLQSDKIEKISSAMPDVLRALQFLPGISINNEFSAEFNVRGGNKDENLILVNGAEVYEPFHLKEASNASVGIFNVDLINNVDLITGGFSAKYGDRLSSVINIEYREGNKERYLGAATLSLAYADGYIEGPIFDKGSFILGVRKTYLEYLIDMMNLDYEDLDRAKPSFYDIQGVFSYDFTSTNKLKFEFLHSGDDFRYNPDASNSHLTYQGEYGGDPAFFIEKIGTAQDNIGDYNSTMLDLQSINFLSNNIFLKTNISYYDQSDDEYRIWSWNKFKEISSDNYYFEKRKEEKINEANLNIKTFEIKTALDYQFTPFYETKTGLSYKSVVYKQSFRDDKIIDNSNTTQHFPDTSYYYNERKGLFFGDELLDAKSYKLNAYLENILQINDNFLINVGGRADYFELNDDLTLSPRVSLAYFSKYGTVLRAAWGEYYQSPIYRQLAYSVPSDTNTQSQHATHYIVGLEQNFNLSSSSLSTLKFKVDAYYKDYKNLISSFLATFDRLAYSRKNDAIGFAKGVDIYILFNIPDFYTWISYGYLEAKEDNLTDEIGEYPRYTDQTHTFTWVADINIGKGWGLNTRFAFGSGFPYTPRISDFNEDTDNFEWNKSEINSEYLPEYKRFDIRVSKDFQFASYTLETFIDLSNVLNFINIQGYEYKFDSIGRPKLVEVALWPIIPSFGVRFNF